MSAKSSKKGAKRESPAAPVTPAASPTPVPATVAATAGNAEAATAWIDSADPRKRMVGKIVLVGVWIYVAALWLLALDQTFHWGIFGPKIAPLP